MDLDALYRAHAAKLIARLVRVAGGRVDWAEAAVHDAFVKAATQESLERPAAWLHRVARNRLTDRARHENVRLRAEIDLSLESEPSAPPQLGSDWDDELLQMIVAACHPNLTPDERVALSLRILCGLPRASIAAIFRADGETIKKRLTSAKRKLRDVGSIEAPAPAIAGDRIEAASRVLYVVFTEGHKPRSGNDGPREGLCAEAIRLAEVLLRKVPEHGPTLHALLALMKLGAARLPARNSASGVVLLEHQDRSRWDARLIDEGLRHLEHSAAGGTVTPYHHEAAIAACHCLAPDFESTDWSRIVASYNALLAERPSVVLEVNRAVAVGFRDSFERGLALLRRIEASRVVGYLPYHAALGSLAERAGEIDTAASAYRVAANLSRTRIDREFFERRVAAVTEAQVEVEAEDEVEVEA